MGFQRRPWMNFSIGGTWRYRVGIAVQPLARDEQPMLAEYTRATRTILISPHVAPRLRFRTLLHELRHAHLLDTHGGDLPQSVEEDCDSAAEFTGSVLKWLHLNGGEAALVKLQPGDFLQPATARQALRTARRCAICETVIAGGAVEYLPSRETVGLATLYAYCEGCGHVQEWEETLDITGRPNGDPQGEPTFHKGEVVTAFLKRHPEAGVVFVD
jgi:hypothetical protein